MNKIILYVTAVFILLAFSTIQAAPRPGDVAQGDSWQAAPNNFNFGNHIDTHIQLTLRIQKGAPKSLKGSFYIIFTGDIDEASGLPIARHPRGAGEHNEGCGVDTIVCVVGWHMDGVPGDAKFVSHSGVNDDDHPLWMVNRADSSALPPPDAVSAIPQPGSFTHYHWITNSSTDPRAITVLPGSECDKNNAGQLQDQLPSAVDKVCQGWYLQIQAVREFAFEHGGEIIPVYLGVDNRSHLNLLTNFNNDVVITPTR